MSGPTLRRVLIARRQIVAAGALLALPVTGCAPGGDLPWLTDPNAVGYRLGTGDQVRVVVFGEDQLSDAYRVDEGGAVTVPLIGAVPAADRTTGQLAETIQTTLRDKKILRDASVTVEVIAFRPVFVLGEVARPGQYPYQPGMTLLTAVAVAGGYTYRAVEDYAGIVRSDGAHPEYGRIKPQGLVAPGDVIKVLERYV